MNKIKKMESIAGAICDEELDALVNEEHVSGESTIPCAVIGAVSVVVAATLSSGKCPTAHC